METIIAAALILLILGLAVGYIARQKKRGVKCIGCPYGSSCCKQKNDGCGGCK